MEGPEIKAVEAVIDNGSFGTRTLRFETGRLAQQADGAVAAYLDDDSMILSTTTAGSSPKENFDFFPLTVDVEEKMYAAGKIPGSFFRREGRPSNEAVLACRIIDRPLRPLFPHTLRNEVQVVETVLSIDPDDSYDMIAMNAASASTMISGLPFEGPVSGVRLALIDDQWVAFPRWSERERAYICGCSGRTAHPSSAPFSAYSVLLHPGSGSRRAGKAQNRAHAGQHRLQRKGCGYRAARGRQYGNPG